MGKQPIKAGRSDLFHLDFGGPIKVVLITDRNDPRYDPRVELPIDETMGQSMLEVGVLLPAVATKIDDTTIVLEDGRQRYKAWNWICTEVRKSAPDAVLPTFPVRLQRSKTALESAIVRVTANTHRQDDDPISRAQNAAKIIELMGESDVAYEKARVAVHCPTLPALKGLLGLLKLAPDIQKQVAAGGLSMSAAVRIARLPEAEQRAVLAEGATTTRSARAAVAKREGKEPSDKPTVTELKAWLESACDEKSDFYLGVAYALRVVLAGKAADTDGLLSNATQRRQ